MSAFKLTEEERAAIHKQHEEATKKEQEKKDLMKKGLQKPDMPKKKGEEVSE